nr:hypothetical protein [Tanacetum cinerariifolium]
LAEMQLPARLLEHLGHRILDRIMNEFPQIKRGRASGNAKGRIASSRLLARTIVGGATHQGAVAARPHHGAHRERAAQQKPRGGLHHHAQNHAADAGERPRAARRRRPQSHLPSGRARAGYSRAAARPLRGSHLRRLGPEAGDASPRAPPHLARRTGPDSAAAQ